MPTERAYGVEAGDQRERSDHRNGTRLTKRRDKIREIDVSKGNIQEYDADNEAEPEEDFSFHEASVVRSYRRCVCPQSDIRTNAVRRLHVARNRAVYMIQRRCSIAKVERRLLDGLAG